MIDLTFVPKWMLFGMLLVSFASSLIVIYFMQVVTKDFGFKCRVAVVMLVQRVLYVGLAVSLVWNGLVIVETADLAPPLPTLAIELFFFALSAVSYWRHKYAPPLPDWASWQTPVDPPVYLSPRQRNGYDGAPAHLH